ncbi:isochorismatase family cysteine hydrolase [Heyndrickxia coagulans]|uniref:isochorismatase family cysteine hydrolase n=1 Tax=Heyndrickxia TaxID=2837504 RepID=UPI0013776AD9|nr:MULTISPECIES: isochorismatase family cysteine hydrolase [Heyndrickxia]MEC2225045.1 cysteine hydrolase [Weizmannia sp. CD-2023]MED4966586.1 cysteine hydrolase [Heyndrickxia coagulans]NCG69227.1 isochorismatase family protein [Heyndrickxia coagulans]
MKALLVLDMQNGILEMKDFSEERNKIKNIIKRFKDAKDLVVLTKHIDKDPNSPLAENNEKSDIDKEFAQYADLTITKTTPSAFFGTKLDSILKEKNIDHLYITGFNTEYCCLFTAITAFEKGYKVTFIEDATGTVNDDDTYEMKGLDINDFVGCILDWSGIIEVLYYEEFEEQYAASI